MCGGVGVGVCGVGVCGGVGGGVCGGGVCVLQPNHFIKETRRSSKSNSHLS